MSKVRTRIAPSPTGLLHIGTARTALFNFLFARQNTGVFVLRVEDTDIERSNEKYEKDIIEGLKWLVIEWDEGIGTKGNYGPYKQTERIEIYKKYIKNLIDEGKAFYCWHTKEELEAEKAEQMNRKEPPRHICSYKLKLRDSKLDVKDAIIRLDMPRKKIAFNDLIRGPVEFDAALLGDISIAKTLDAPLYNFAVVIDDYKMKISHVIRGEDHISNTPKQIAIQEALGFKSPKYAHLPLILGSNKSKMSKRHGAVSINWYREQGYLSEAMVNFMALLGWNPGDNREIFSMDELIKEFAIEKIQKSGAIFNIEKLNWINGQYIRKLPIDKLTELCIPYLKDCNKKNKNYIKKIVSLGRDRLKKISDIADLTDFFFKDKLEYGKELLIWKDMNDNDLKNILTRILEIFSNISEKDFTKERMEPLLKKEAEEAGGNGPVFWPLRVALSGKKASPGPLEIAEILGKERSVKRVGDAIKEIKNSS